MFAYTGPLLGEIVGGAVAGDAIPTNPYSTTMQTSVAWGGVTYTFFADQAMTTPKSVAVGFEIGPEPGGAGGRPFFVDTGAGTWVFRTPGGQVDPVSGARVSGAMLNPRRANVAGAVGSYHGLDGRITGYQSYLDVANPIIMRPGDELVQVVYRLEQAGNHWARFQSTSNLQCVKRSPQVGTMIQSILGGSQFSPREHRIIDTSTWSFPSRTVTGQTAPTTTEIIDRLKVYNPALALIIGPEERRKLSPVGSATDNYGQRLAEAHGPAFLALSDTRPHAEKVQIGLAFCRYYMDGWFAFKNSSIGMGADGATSLGTTPRYAIGAWLAGDIADLSLIRIRAGGNEWRQVAALDATLQSRLRTPHDNTGFDWPWISRRKNVAVDAGTVITLVDYPINAYTSWRPPGTQMVRESDGQARTITAMNSATKQITVDAAFSPALVPGVDKVFMRPTVEVPIDWFLKGIGRLDVYMPSRNANYRVQFRGFQMIAGLQSLGLLDATHKLAWDYIKLADFTANYPAADNDWPTTVASSPGFPDWSLAMVTQNFAAIDAMPFVGD